MLSIFTTISNPESRGDLWLPAIQSYSELADEVIIIDGGTEETLRDLPRNCRVVKSEWSYEFSWELIGQQFTKGYRECKGDWVIYADIDMVFHEKDYNLIRRLLDENPNQIALSMWKYQFILPDRYNLKSRLVNVINKKLVGERVSFDSGGDLCRPSLDGVEILPSKTKEMRVPIYNYEKMMKSYAQIFDDVGRMARAWERHFGETKLGKDSEEAFDRWAKMLVGRFNKPHKKIELVDHPMVMIPFILMLDRQNFGYSAFDMLEVNAYA